MHFFYYSYIIRMKCIENWCYNISLRQDLHIHDILQDEPIRKVWKLQKQMYKLLFQEILNLDNVTGMRL